MKILIERIPEEGSRYEGDDPGAILELDSDSLIKVVGDVGYSLYAQHVSGELIVRGKLSVDLALKCIRCAEFFSTSIEDSDFLRAYSAPEGVESIDISEDMREDILLNIPVFPVCSEGCKGLCVQCGTNLNRDSCSCRAVESPNLWQALDNLHLKNLKEESDGSSKKKNVEK